MYQLLIVDDEEDIRRGMARGIPWNEWGFEVAGQAENGEEAVRIIGEKHPDVGRSDIRMPKMDGIELMQYLHENNPEIKIIILSGYNDVEYLNMAIRNQVTEYLLKPTDIDEFETLFHRLKEKLDEEGIRRRELESLKVSAMQNKELSYARVLSNLLDGYVGGEEEYGWKEEMEDTGMNFDCCMMAVLDAQPVGNGERDDHYQLKQRIIRYCNSREMVWEKHFFLNRDRKVVGIITLKDGSDGALEAIGRCIKELQGEIGDIYGLALLAGLSGLCSSEEKLPEIYGNTGKHVSSMAPDLSAGQKKTGMLVTSIREYLDREYCSNLVSLEATAEQFRKNPAYISKVFKKETGFNFSDYITQKRMAHSKLLLRDMSLKIYEIAEMTGYADASNFIKVFKKHCGMSPNEYRGLHN